MRELIEALTIFLKYVEEGSYQDMCPTNCTHDLLWVNVEPELVSSEDLKTLDALGFFPLDNGFGSYKFGSC